MNTRAEEQEFRRQIMSILPRLNRFSFMLARSRAEADDLLQTACERALRHIDQWNPATRLDSWMFRIIQTIWLNELRSRKVRDGYVEMTQLAPEAADDGEQAAESRILLRRVEQEMRQLPEEQRIVLMLVCVEGMTYREAAETTDIPIGTVMSRLSRARLSLMQRLGDASVDRHDNVRKMSAR